MTATPRPQGSKAQNDSTPHSNYPSGTAAYMYERGISVQHTPSPIKSKKSKKAPIKHKRDKSTEIETPALRSLSRSKYRTIPGSSPPCSPLSPREPKFQSNTDELPTITLTMYPDTKNDLESQVPSTDKCHKDLLAKIAFQERELASTKRQLAESKMENCLLQGQHAFELEQLEKDLETRRKKERKRLIQEQEQELEMVVARKLGSVVAEAESLRKEKKELEEFISFLMRNSEGGGIKAGQDSGIQDQILKPHINNGYEALHKELEKQIK